MTAWPAGVTVRADEPLARHTALRTGGPCDLFVVVHRVEALSDALATCSEPGWSVLGAGTRTVVRDGGVAGAVVRLGTGFCALSCDGLCWEAGAAVPVAALVAATSGQGHAGIEGRAAVPGSLGASLLLDPGWDAVVDSVRFWRRGKVRHGSLEEARAGRRPLILGARLRLAEDDRGAVRLRARDALAGAGAWSWYERPGRVSLRAVLDRAGLAGVRLRQVALPASAPETMVNLGGGTAADLALLQRSVVARVQKERGVELKLRVRYAGHARRGA